MRRIRLSSWIVFVGVLLLIAASGLSESFLAQWRDMSGPQSLAALSVNVDLAADPTGSARLTIREAEKLAERWERPITYSARTPAAVTGGDRSIEADVVGVGGRTGSFANLRMYRGSPIAAQSIEEYSRVTAISSRLADQLFRTRDVVGMTVQLLGATFKIVGVYEEPDTLLRRMTDNGKPDLLVPITTLIELDPAVQITTIELAAGPTAAVTGTDEVRKALAAIGKPPSRYKIVNYAAEQNWVDQKPKLLLATAGVTGLLLGVRLAWGRLKRTVAFMRRGLSTDDWPDVVRKGKSALAVDAAALIGLMACAFMLGMAVRHRFYIPDELVPDELIDWTFYRDKRLEWWQRQVGAMGYVASSGELVYDRVNVLVTRLATVGILIGLPLLGIGVREWAMGGLSTADRLIRLAACIGAAVAATAAACWWAGTEYVVRPQELFVFVSLFVLSALSARAVGRNGS
ncbi:ABC transporter permease [Paenibacillus hodogayensis]|uniref:ABC transporter permease n=1 Tax=Paenibacillus hodogayensis TaxID=279208 RepID=A0ABV5W5R8_9BACL